MKKTDGMFTRICHEVAADYPEITAEDWYIDIMTANLVNPEIRSRFQVFVLPNLYGDIITDEAAQLQGGGQAEAPGAADPVPVTVVTVQPEDDRKLLLLTGAGALALAVLGALCALRYYTRGRRSS